MNFSISSFVLALVLGALPLACKGGAPEGTQQSAVPKTESATGSTAHAPSGVAPGSHEDWCAEHAVPESMCTRCNPALVAAFKATGDWCPEHGVPESQCLLCNPGLKIERPPKKEAAK